MHLGFIVWCNTKTESKKEGNLLFHEAGIIFQVKHS